ncbi:MAG: hypothetical protein BGO67_09895 [Alphaproteobacteria bacterium 41-28]|nr:MAG: hypothetical protein BGO67_09895 [Alphaproteobacteria bacterium 41-28]
MIYRKYPLLFLLTLSFVQSSHATLRGTEAFNSTLEGGNSSRFSTTKTIRATQTNNVKEFDFKKYIPNMKYNDVASKEKEKIENYKPDLRKLLETLYQGLNSSQEHSLTPMTQTYLKENNRRIAINRELMDSGFILSVSGNTALRLSDSLVYTVISNPGVGKTDTRVKEIEARLDLAEEKERPLAAERQAERKEMLEELGKKSYNLRQPATPRFHKLRKFLNLI